MTSFGSGSLVRLSRKSLNLTQEDFASDLGKSRTLLAQWESGRRPVPREIKRVALDILGGYYKNHPDIRQTFRIVDEFDGFSSVLQSRHLGLYGNNAFISHWNKKMPVEHTGAPVLSYIPQDALVVGYSESHTLEMLENRSRFARLVIRERSVLIADRYVTRDITRVNVGVGVVLLLRETLSERSPDNTEASWAVAVTMDGTEEILAGNPPPGIR